MSSQVKQNTLLSSSILRLQLGQYVEQRTDITFTFISSQFHVYGTYAAPLPSSPISFQSYLFNYLSLCTSATQLMCEPCSVLQSGPRFDFLQRFFSFYLWNLCSASAIQFPMDLCSASAIQPISFLSFFYEPMQRLCHPVHFFFSRCKSKLSIQLNCKSQVPNSLSCFSLWAICHRKTKLPLYPLRILCKVLLLQILLNSMPAFW